MLNLKKVYGKEPQGFMYGQHGTCDVTQLCLSPLTINDRVYRRLLFAGNWCLNHQSIALLNQAGVEYEVCKTRRLLKEEYINEANLCMELYDKYINILAKELNRLHNTSYSTRYWNTLLHRFLYPLIACVIDKYNILKDLADARDDLVADIIDYKDPWTNPHTFPSFGSSRILHLLIFSIIVGETGIIPGRVIDAEIVNEALGAMGDGKKDTRSMKRRMSSLGNLKTKARFLLAFRRALKREMPLWMFKYSRSNVLALGDQYLPATLLKRLLSKAAGTAYCFYANEWNTSQFSEYDGGQRRTICFPPPESSLEVALQKCIQILLPTVYVENFHLARRKVDKLVPKKKLVILNSQNYSGRELVDFYIAQSVEDNGSHHLQICHGGCYGVMKISVQEKVWAQVSDTYALWSNAKSYGANCACIKMPSLRFHKWQGYLKDKTQGHDITLFLTGYYPALYAYNSIYPYTIDETYEQWQIRFLSEIASDNLKSIVIRDFHRSGDIGLSELQCWARERNVRMDSSPSMAETMSKSKIAVQTVPQTTYLETITADLPTICYWNPESNFLRRDLQVYFNRLADVGVLHFSPESAARHINEIGNDPLKWWHSDAVREALKSFRDNVCCTLSDGIDQWADFISARR